MYVFSTGFQLTELINISDIFHKSPSQLFQGKNFNKHAVILCILLLAQFYVF